jgi:uncharacterized protein (TIGR03437 family)
VETVAPSLFAANGNGMGPAAAYIRRFTAGDPAFEFVFDCAGGAGSCAARRITFGAVGERIFLTLYGIGIRGRTALSSVTVTIGTTNLTPIFGDRQGELIGVDQVDVELPRALAGSGVQNVRVTVNGVRSNTVQLAF